MDTRMKTNQRKSVRRTPRSATALLGWWKPRPNEIHLAVAGTQKIVSANPKSRNYHPALFEELNRWLS